MSKDLYSAIKERRSIYSISKETTISDDRIQEVVAHAVKHTPSAFNSQSSRVILLFGDSHDELWETTREALRKIVPEEFFAQTNEKINSFKNGYATILFFEDQTVIESLQNQFAAYKDNFPVWSQQAAGMLQFAVWTSLESEGLGASLQHYNELIEQQIKQRWQIPENWKLIAQMPFGKPTAGAPEKEFSDLSNRIKVYR